MCHMLWDATGCDFNALHRKADWLINWMIKMNWFILPSWPAKVPLVIYSTNTSLFLSLQPDSDWLIRSCLKQWVSSMSFPLTCALYRCIYMNHMSELHAYIWYGTNVPPPVLFFCFFWIPPRRVCMEAQNIPAKYSFCPGRDKGHTDADPLTDSTLVCLDSGSLCVEINHTRSECQ